MEHNTVSNYPISRPLGKVTDWSYHTLVGHFYKTVTYLIFKYSIFFLILFLLITCRISVSILPMNNSATTDSNYAPWLKIIPYLIWAFTYKLMELGLESPQIT